MKQAVKNKIDSILALAQHQATNPTATSGNGRHQDSLAAAIRNIEEANLFMAEIEAIVTHSTKVNS